VDLSPGTRWVVYDPLVSFRSKNPIEDECEDEATLDTTPPVEMADEKEDDDDDNSCSDSKEDNNDRSGSDKGVDKNVGSTTDGNSKTNVFQDDNSKDGPCDYYGYEDDDYEDEGGDFDSPEKASRISEDSTRSIQYRSPTITGRDGAVRTSPQ
jgi:hypothetical protein